MFKVGICTKFTLNPGPCKPKGPAPKNSKPVKGLASRPQHQQITVYNLKMAKDVIRISEAEAASDFAALMGMVRAGAKVIIEDGARPVAVLHAAEPERRSISECIAMARAHEEESGKSPVLDPDFAKDVEEIVSHREPWNPPQWE
jgi:antitoxin (DNA-binding transcriptional repressor) of toxin-antitoxin stability system